MFRSQPLVSRLPALCLSIAAGATLGVSLVCLIVPISWDDQAFALYAAPRLLDGYHLYGTDIMELQPPLIFWMTMIPAFLARSVNVTTQVAFVLCLATLICAIILWSLRLNSDPDRKPRSLYVAGLAIILLFVMTVLPNVFLCRNGCGAIRYDFGQREHIMTLLILPYLFSAARRLDGRKLGAFEAVLVGVAAAIGFSLKPQYLTVAVGVEALLIFRMRDFRYLLRPELLTLILGGLAYCIVVWILTPNYVTDAVPFFSQIYGSYGYVRTLRIIYHPSTLVVAGLAAALIWRSRDDALATIFLVAGIGAFIAFVLQHKDWSDHLLPVQMLLILSLGVAAMSQLLGWLDNRLQTAFTSRALVTAVTMVSCLVALGTYYPARAALSAGSEREKEIAETNEATRNFQAGTAFVALTDGIDFQFNLANARGLVWASRYPCLVLPAVTLQQANAPVGQPTGGYLMIPALIQKLRGGSSAYFGEREYVQKLRSDVLEDFHRWNPEIVLVRRCDAESESCVFGDNFNVIEWLLAEPGFDSIWSNYRLSRRLKKYDLYVLSR
jgi:hypothetical protein